jgi:hypothetical protein
VSAAMDKIRPDEVIDFFEYEKVRDARRASVIELKRRRRVSVGRYVSLVFENRETVLFQIQEMCRAERIADDAKVREELDVYNALLPGPRELSATLFIEIEDMACIQPILDQLMGIDTGQCVWLQVGREFAVPGEFEAGHSDADKGKLAAVHFVRFRFSPEAARAFREAEVHLVMDHPAERARTRLSNETRAALLPDLAG